MRYSARFFPQAWQNDYAIDVDAEGPVEWDVTDYLNSLPEEQREKAMEGDSYESDELRYDPNAPDWILHWQGPFAIHVVVEKVSPSLQNT